ncbi:MAG: cbb3-type cytochrome oxidase assembly protein CcoS [Lysobacterales bacterium]
MSILYVLIPLALMLLAVAAWALIWAIRTGQFDDLESHGWSVVLDDDQKPPPDPEVDPVGIRLAAETTDKNDKTE